MERRKRKTATSKIISDATPMSFENCQPPCKQSKSEEKIYDLAYNTNGPKRGNVLIINNIHFLNKIQERTGAQKDDEDLSKLLEKIGFDIKIHRNLSKSTMERKIKDFKKGLGTSDISLIVMMSHGNNIEDGKIIPGGYTKILGSDGKGLEIENILSEFEAKNCPLMKGKPKIFIFQCCRGAKHETVEISSLHADSIIKRKKVRGHGDILIGYSTLPGFVSWRSPTEGTLYIQSLCKVFKNFAQTEDIETMLKMVDQELSDMASTSIQTSSYESRGFNKRCFLNPVNSL